MRIAEFFVVKMLAGYAPIYSSEHPDTPPGLFLNPSHRTQEARLTLRAGPPWAGMGGIALAAISGVIRGKMSRRI
jgi:hypothetical protein